MIPTTSPQELSFDAYQERQLHEITPAGLTARAAKLHASGRFSWTGAGWKPAPYVGHAVLATMDAAEENAEATRVLAEARDDLIAGYGRPDALFALPTESFHQTVANTLSAENHERLVVARGLEAAYPGRVARVLAELDSAGADEAPAMRMVGLALFGGAVGALGIFYTESGFERVLGFRDRFYGHAEIAGLGIRRTRPFIGHVTLAYLERAPDEVERARIVAVAGEINRGLARRELRFAMPRAELRAYAHLAEFRALSGLPVCTL
jgi:hypothetical protein